MLFRNILCAAALMGLIIISGCYKTDEITNPGIELSINSPSVANGSQSFAYALKASAYNSSTEYSLSFSGLNLSIALSLTSYSTGDVSIQLWDANKQMLSKLDYNSNTNLTQPIGLESAPSKIKLVFSNFSGLLNFTLSSK